MSGHLPFFVILIVSYIYDLIKDSAYVKFFFAGLLAAVGAVILDAVISIVRSLIRDKSVLSLVALILSFIAVRFFKVNVIIVILSSLFFAWQSR